MASTAPCKMRRVPADHSPRRIVSLQPSVTVILDAVGRLDRLVACTKYCVDVCPEVAKRGITIVKDSWTSTEGEIRDANPDLVIASVPYQEKSITEILRAGVRFLGLAPRTLNDIYADIAIISGLVGAADRGDSLIAEMQEEITQVRTRTANRTRPRVFCEEWGKPLINSQPWVAELVEAAGGEFLGRPGATTSADAVLSANPDILVAAWCGAGDRVPLEKIVRERGWSGMNAAKHGRIYCIRDEFLNTPAPTLIRGLHALAAAIHPQDFPHPAGLRCISEAPLPAGQR